jgi:predicted Fe-Mo cluster-binding NifX family protein
MKIAISSTGKELTSKLSDVFARCPYFFIVKSENGKLGETEVIENNNVQQMGGAGISAAQLMAENDVNIVISGNVGPRALDVLKQFSIDVYVSEGTIEEVLQLFLEGKLKKYENSDSNGQ